MILPVVLLLFPLLLLLAITMTWSLLLVYERWHTLQAPTVTVDQLWAAFVVTPNEYTDKQRLNIQYVNRVVVAGCSGSGKSELSRALSHHLHLPLVVLDELFWIPHWRGRSALQLQRRVLAAINDVKYDSGGEGHDEDSSDDEGGEMEEKEKASVTSNNGGRCDKPHLTALLRLRNYRQRGFVIDGNYFRKLNSATLSRCQLVVHLHLPFLVTFRQILSRTVIRYWHRQRVCNGNVENLHSVCCASDAVIPWMMKTHPSFVTKVNGEVRKANEGRVAEQSEDGPIRVLRILNDADRRLLLHFVATMKAVTAVQSD